MTPEELHENTEAFLKDLKVITEKHGIEFRFIANFANDETIRFGPKDSFYDFTFPALTDYLNCGVLPWMPRQLVIVRGTAGSGKTTHAKKKYVTQGYAHYEADMYIEQMPGGYQANITHPTTRIAAHAWCLAQTEQALRAGRNVVVSNTFYKRAFMEPYLQLAEKYGAQVTIENLLGIVGNGSVHGVSAEVLQRQIDNWED